MAHVKLLQNGLAGIVGILPPYLCLHSGPKIVVVSQGEERDCCLGELAPLFGLLEEKILHLFSKRRVP